MMYKPIALTLAVLALAMLPAGAANAIEYGDPLVGNVFVTGFDGWTDQYYQHGSAGGHHGARHRPPRGRSVYGGHRSAGLGAGRLV